MSLKSLNVPVFNNRRRASSSNESQTPSIGQGDTPEPEFAGTIDYAKNYATGEFRVILSPTPPSDQEAQLTARLEEYLPNTSLKPELLVHYKFIKHDTFDEVEAAAPSRGLKSGSGWRVPLRYEPSVDQTSGGLPPLGSNRELTISPWGDDSANPPDQDWSKTSKAGADTSHDSCHGDPVPTTTTSGSQTSILERSGPVAEKPKRTDSAPFYIPSGDYNQYFDGDSSAGAWGR